MRKHPDMAAFLASRRHESGCWVYPSTRDRDGYAIYCDRRLGRGKTTRAHRVAWLITRGPLPEGLVLRHACDNPPCCNPDHLDIGTQKENCLDAMARDRHSRGERNGNARLTRDQVVAIRADPRRQVDIAGSFGIRQTTVSEIKLRHRWRHV